MFTSTRTNNSNRWWTFSNNDQCERQGTSIRSNSSTSELSSLPEGGFNHHSPTIDQVTVEQATDVTSYKSHKANVRFVQFEHVRKPASQPQSEARELLSLDAPSESSARKCVAMESSAPEIISSSFAAFSTPPKASTPEANKENRPFNLIESQDSRRQRGGVENISMDIRRIDMASAMDHRENELENLDTRTPEAVMTVHDTDVNSSELMISRRPKYSELRHVITLKSNDDEKLGDADPSEEATKTNDKTYDQMSFEQSSTALLLTSDCDDVNRFINIPSNLPSSYWPKESQVGQSVSSAKTMPTNADTHESTTRISTRKRGGAPNDPTQLKHHQGKYKSCEYQCCDILFFNNRRCITA